MGGLAAVRGMRGVFGAAAVLLAAIMLAVRRAGGVGGSAVPMVGRDLGL